MSIRIEQGAFEEIPKTPAAGDASVIKKPALEKKFCCSADGCRKRYRWKRDLKRHMITHTQPQPSGSPRSPSPAPTSAVTSPSVPTLTTTPVPMAAGNCTLSDNASEPGTGPAKRFRSYKEAVMGAPEEIIFDKVLSPTTAACTDRLVLSQTEAGWNHVGQHLFNDANQTEPIHILSHQDYWAAVHDQKCFDENKAELSNPYFTPRSTEDHALLHGQSADVPGIMELLVSPLYIAYLFCVRESVLWKMLIIANSTHC